MVMDPLKVSARRVWLTSSEAALHRALGESAHGEMGWAPSKLLPLERPEGFGEGASAVEEAWLAMKRGELEQAEAKARQIKEQIDAKTKTMQAA